jgi:hypothetical protein
LFRRFAGLASAGWPRETVEDFAARFGPLGTGTEEELATWVSRAVFLGQLVTAADELAAGDKQQRLSAVARLMIGLVGVIPSVQPTLGFTPPPKSRPILEVEAPDLWSALLLQFVFATVAGHQFRACARCGRWFVIGARGSRTDRVTCSITCRSALYLARKSERSAG